MKFGSVVMTDRTTFHWMQRDTPDAEVHGHMEYERGGILPGTSGWYRTNDPAVAARTAAQQRGTNVVAGQGAGCVA